MTMKVMTAIMAASFVAAGGAAWAATADGTLTVSAQVINACAVATTTLAFGQIGAGSAEVATANNGAITITCSGADSSVLDSVLLTSPQSAFEMAKSGAADIPYTLKKTDAAGDAVGYNTNVSSLFAKSGTTTTVFTLPLFGTVADAGTVLGSFSDTVTVTVTYSEKPAG